MSAVTVPTAPGQEQRREEQQRCRELFGPAKTQRGLGLPRGYDAMLAGFVLAFGLALVYILPAELNQDSWLAFVAGRIVAGAGVAHHVTLTVMAAGRPWRDQQWLAQLIMYGLQQLGGIGLDAVVQAAVTIGAVWGAATVARRLGALPRGVLLVFPLAAYCVVAPPTIRAQSFGYPLFVLVVWLLAADSRRPSLRALWCIPVLLLWANLHGAVTLGAGLAVLRGITVLFEPGALHDRTSLGKAAALVIGAPLCLLATPFGLSIVAYYDSTLFNPGFHTLVSEWRPATASVYAAVPTFALGAIAIWSFGRHQRACTRFEQLTLLVLIAGAIMGLRNLPWLGLGMLMLLPLTVTAGIRPRSVPFRPRALLDRTLVLATAGGLAFAVAHTLSTWDGRVGDSYPRAAIPVLRAATADPSVRVYADERYADWLLWELPRLRGRVAYDTSFELLTTHQLRAIVAVKSMTGIDWRRTLAGYRVLALSQSEDPDLISALERTPGTREIFDRHGLVVLEREP